MSYIRSLILNFLIVFFVDRISPGVEIVTYYSVPEIGTDILYSIVVGFLNASVYPFLAILEIKITKLKLAVFTFVISYAAFIAIAIVPFGIKSNVFGVFFGGSLVWVMAYFTNYFEWRHDVKKE